MGRLIGEKIGKVREEDTEQNELAWVGVHANHRDCEQ